MAARRCSTCSINWPLHVRMCGQCGGPLWHLNEDDPDPGLRLGDAASADEEYELRGDADRVYDPERYAKVVAWRTECFTRAGVDELTATSLAVRRDIDRVLVERMATAGATGAELRAILL